MNELKVLESNGLIKVYETNTGEKVVNARELHEGLESKRQFADWIKQRLSESDAIEHTDYISLSQKCEGNNATKIEYILKLPIAKEMAMLERNEKGKEYRKYLMSIEEKYRLDISKLSPELQMFKQIFDTVALTQLKQQEIVQAVADTNTRIDSIREVVALDSTAWRADTQNLLNKIAVSLGGTSDFFRQLRTESYELIDRRMGTSLQIRLTNKRRRMADEGVCKSKRDVLTKMDVIADDKKLIEGYVAIIKEMAIKYGIADKKVG